MKILPAVAVFLVFLLTQNVAHADQHRALNETLDSFHRAAAEADFERYTALMTGDIVFLGTDATERWQGESFPAFARPYFESGQGWEYRPYDRTLTVSKAGDVAWFDELLRHDRLGVCRGSGVLVLENGVWKVAQYNLSVPIPNDIVYSVANQIQSDDRATMEGEAQSETASVEEADAAPEKKCRERRHKTNRKASC